MHGVANGNGKAAFRLYQELFPRRCIQTRRIFQRLHRQMWGNGSFITGTIGGGRWKTARQTLLNKVILDHVDETYGISTRAAASRLYVCQQTVWRVLLLECW
ncbi:hypothetical protein TNCV_3087131 [Trichonephila clavipes]|nr:hypothetical protein TNCV_3087131 [Trichonephila clavipes]